MTEYWRATVGEHEVQATSSGIETTSIVLNAYLERERAVRPDGTVAATPTGPWVPIRSNHGTWLLFLEALRNAGMADLEVVVEGADLGSPLPAPPEGADL